MLQQETSTVRPLPQLQASSHSSHHLVQHRSTMAKRGAEDQLTKDDFEGGRGGEDDDEVSPGRPLARARAHADCVT